MRTSTWLAPGLASGVLVLLLGGATSCTSAPDPGPAPEPASLGADAVPSNPAEGAGTPESEPPSEGEPVAAEDPDSPSAPEDPAQDWVGVHLSGPTDEELQAELGLLELEMRVGFVALRVFDPHGRRVVGARVNAEGPDGRRIGGMTTNTKGVVGFNPDRIPPEGTFAIGLGSLGWHRIPYADLDPGGEVRVVRTPEVSELELVWVDPEGNPTRGTFQLEVVEGKRRRARSSGPVRSHADWTAELPLAVAPGQRYAIFARRYLEFDPESLIGYTPDRTLEATPVEVPPEPGRVRVEVPVDRGGRLLVLRLVGEDGAPLRRVVLRPGVERDGEVFEMTRLLTSPEGELHLWFQDSTEPEFDRLTFDVVRDGGLDLRGEVALNWEGEVLRPEPVVLVEQPEPLPERIVSGHVRLADGQPVEAARVVVQAPRPTDPSGRTWQDIGGGSVATDAEGAFEVRGVPPDGTLRVHVTSIGHAVEARRIEVGDRVELTAWPQGRAVVALPEGERWSSLRPIQPRWVLREPVRAGVDFGRTVFPGKATSQDAGRHFQVLPPGTYDLELSIGPDGFAFVTIEDFEVPPGGACEDPRLRDFDLERWVEWVPVTLVTPDGTPEPRGDYQLVDSGGEFQGFGIPFTGPRFRVPRYEPGSGVRVHVPGYAPATLLPVEPDAELVLRPRPDLRFELAQGSLDGCPEFEVWGHFFYEHAPGLEASSSSRGGWHPVAEGVLFEDVAARTGRLELTLREPGARDPACRLVFPDLEVPERFGEVELELVLEGENLDKIDRLRER